MPIYEYQCDDCGHQFEQLVASHRSRPSCPECDSRRLQRQFSTFAAHQGGSEPTCQAPGQCPSSLPGGGCSSGSCPLGS